jgi:hypothetical protein
MSAELKVSIAVERDGQPVPGLSVIRRLIVDEVQQFPGIERASGGGFVALPTGELDSIQVLVVKTDQDVTLRVDGQSDAGVVINAGGLIALVDVTIDAGAATNALLDNSSGTAVRLDGVAGGT